jgi:hypothetical protein
MALSIRSHPDRISPAWRPPQAPRNGSAWRNLFLGCLPYFYNLAVGYAPDPVARPRFMQRRRSYFLVNFR